MYIMYTCLYNTCVLYIHRHIYILAASLICTVSETLKVLKILMYRSFTHKLLDYSSPI